MQKDQSILEAIYARCHPLDADVQRTKAEVAKAEIVLATARVEMARAVYERKRWDDIVKSAEALFDETPCNSVFFDLGGEEPHRPYTCGTKKRGHFGQHDGSYGIRWTEEQAVKPNTPAWVAFLANHGGKDPGCSSLSDSQAYTCFESDAVNNACPACERCTLKAGYASVKERLKAVA